MWHSSKIEEKECTPSMVLTTVPHQDERGTSWFRLWKNFALTDGWLRSWLRTMHFSSSILLLIIYLSSKYTCNVEKMYPFWNNRPLKPIFCNYINSSFFFKTQVWCIFPTWCWEDIYKYKQANKNSNILYRIKTQFKIQWRDPEY